MSKMALQKDNHYTYADYLNGPEDERWEIIDGRAYAMVPPSPTHQAVLRQLTLKIGNYLEDKTCELYFAPFAVRFPEKNERDEDVTTVVEPDLLVICDNSKIDEKGLKGAPDFIIEILSPSTASYDMIQKRRLYERHGVREYWLVDPTNRTVMVYTLKEKNKYGEPEIYGSEDEIKVHLFDDLVLNMKDVFGPARKEP